MDDMINRHDSIAEENIEPNGRPAKDQFEEWSGEVVDRADDVFNNDKKDDPIKDREKRIKRNGRSDKKRTLSKGPINTCKVVSCVSTFSTKKNKHKQIKKRRK